jgi:hypothetical protein
MPPAPFRLEQLLSDWPQCRLEIRCPACGSIAIVPVTMMLRRRGDQSFAALLGRLSCKRCKGRPAPVYLCAGHRSDCHGASPDWAVELVAPPAEQRNTLDKRFTIV